MRTGAVAARATSAAAGAGGKFRALSRGTAAIALALGALSGFAQAVGGAPTLKGTPLFMQPVLAALVVGLAGPTLLEAEGPGGRGGARRLAASAGLLVVAACGAAAFGALPASSRGALLGFALLGVERLAASGSRIPGQVSTTLLRLAFFVGTTSLLGTLTRSSLVAGLGLGDPVPVATSLTLPLLAASRSFHRSRARTVGWVTASDVGARLARRVLVAGAAAPLGAGVVASVAVRAGAPGPLVVVGAVVVVAGALALTAHRIARTTRDLDRRRARGDRQLERARRELADILEASPLAVYARDVDERYLFVNRAWEEGTGLLRAGVIGRHVREIFPGEAVDLARVDQELLASGGTLEREESLTFGGADHVVVSRKFALRDASGRVYGVCGMSFDVTERKRAEAAREALTLEVAARSAELERANAELERANADLDGFTYSVSHDLRAPLRAIDGFSKILVEDHGPSLDPDAQRVLGVVRKNVVRMGQLIDDLLAFSRLGRASLSTRAVDVAELLDAVVESVSALEPGRVVSVERGELPPVSGDPNLLRQVFENLVSNAFKYTRPRERAKVHVAGERTGDEVTYRVTDNGVGFDARYADKLFRVFSRLHKPTDFEGTGVGLALVDRIVQRHGGRVFARSTLGEGATFGFTLPAAAASAAATEEAAS